MHVLVAGALASSPLALLVNDIDARKKGKKLRRKKRKNNKQQPAPQVRADATCPGPPTNGTILSSHGVLAQSFTASQTGLLVRADLQVELVEPFSTGSLFLRLAPLLDAFPEPVSLASARVAASSVATGRSVVTFTFANPAAVNAGVPHALVLSSDGDGRIAWSNRTSSACDGRSFRPESSAEPPQVDEEFDLLFTTFVQS
jgi:hypothetical protein